MAVPLCVLLHICVAVHNPGGGTQLGFTDTIGVNYGRVADNLPSPPQAVSLIQSMNFKLVKLFDANAQVLTALANTSIKVTIMVRNEDIGLVSSSEDNGEQWVKQNVLPYYPYTQIIVIVVGNEIFSDPKLAQAWQQLLPAMENLLKALVKYKLDGKIKITTSSAGDVLAVSYPPSSGKFRSDIRDPVMKPLLRFLQRTSSPFYINLYPYFAWASDPVNISLSYALFDPSAKEVKDGKHRYKNLLDAMTDATYAAMEDLGFGDVALGVSETGWPTAGDGGEKGATVANAALYNQRLIQKALAAGGTPRRPGVPVQYIIFALFNENLKPGPATERNWGLLYPDGRHVYSLKLAEEKHNAPTSVAVQTPARRRWCVASAGADVAALQAELDRVCGRNAADCTAIQAGQRCYLPNTLIAHASYAFSSAWSGGAVDCSFSGAAVLTDVDPSYGSCVYPSLDL